MKNHKLKDLSHYTIRDIAIFLAYVLKFDCDMAVGIAYYFKFPERGYIPRPDALMSKCFSGDTIVKPEMVAKAKHKEARLTDTFLELRTLKQRLPYENTNYITGHINQLWNS